MVCSDINANHVAKKFTKLTNTILEKSPWSWNVWTKVLSIPRWRSHPIHENRATESIWTEPCNPLLRATKSTKRATLT